jgi:hypothetical protein
MGRLLIGIGIAILALGLLVQFFPALRPGKLPGDFAFGNGNVRVFIPLGTSILLSILLTLALSLFVRR